MGYSGHPRVPLNLSPVLPCARALPCVATASTALANISVVFVDAAFDINKDKTPKIGIRAMVRECGTGKVNIVYYPSSKSRLSIADGYDLSTSIKDSIQRVTGRENIPFVPCTDSRRRDYSAKLMLV